MSGLELGSRNPRERERGTDPPYRMNAFEREIYVLSTGFSEGFQQACHSIGPELARATRQFFRDPLTFSYEFVQNHGCEALIGAAITFANPRGLANLALVGYSLRGVLGSTLSAMYQASDANANVYEIKNHYRDALGQEGTAFLASLPVTMLGGIAGRAAANSVFGRNMGLYDAVCGRVSRATIQENLWSIRDNAFPPAVRLVVTDLDNTLFPFSRACAISLREAINDLSIRTGLTEDLLYRSIGAEMKRHGSFSYAWGVELALAEQLRVGRPGGMTAEWFRTEISEPFWQRSESLMREHGQAFPDINRGLEALSARRVPVAVLTNASSIALSRLQNIGLLDGRLIQRVYALADAPPPSAAQLPAELLRHGAERLAAQRGTPHNLQAFEQLPREWEKPDPRGLRMIAQQYGLRPSQVLMVGDGILNDIGTARLAGTRGLLIRQPFTTPEFEAILNRLSAQVKDKKAGTGGTFTAQPPWFDETPTFAGVADFLNPRPNLWSILRSTGSALAVRPELSSAVSAYGFERGSALAALRREQQLNR